MTAITELAKETVILTKPELRSLVRDLKAAKDLLADQKENVDAWIAVHGVWMYLDLALNAPELLQKRRRK